MTSITEAMALFGIPLPPSFADIKPWVVFLAQLVELAGSAVIALFVAAALITLIAERGIGITQSRILIAQGVVWALNLKAGAALLKSLVIQSWSQLAFLAAILIIRTVVKNVFAYEAVRLERREKRQRSARGENVPPIHHPLPPNVR